MREIPLPTLPFSELRPPRTERQAIVGRRAALTPTTPSHAGFDVTWARTEDDVRAAQRLRYQIFAEEMGAKLSVPVGTPSGHDVDIFDRFCEHLLVRTTTSHGRPGPVIGTYRVLTPEAAKRAGGLYSDTEFDLTRLRGQRSRLIELGRSCVHPDHRSGGAIMALWAALAEFMQRNNLDTMIGCASISMRDGGHFAASLWKQLSLSHMAEPDWHVHPRLPLPVDELRQDLQVEAPPLIKGYLRCGARILGRPAWDPSFNTADLPMMMRLADLPARYRRHFLNQPA